MIWKETGVRQDSYMCFFTPSEMFKEHYYYMHSCGYFQCDSNYNVEYEGSRPPLFIYIINGSLELEYDSKHYTAYDNEIILINCCKPQHYYCSDSCEFLFFHFGGKSAPSITDHLIFQNGAPVFSLKNAQEIYRNINEPIMKLCYQEQTSNAYLSSIVYSTLCLIQSCNEVLPSAISPYSDLVTEIITYINNHIERSFTVQELSEKANLSPFYFSRLFKKETGCSPLEYVSMTKINYAKAILRTTSMPVSELAEYLGYSSSASFINAFKKRRGLSPNKYRNLFSFPAQESSRD